MARRVRPEPAWETRKGFSLRELQGLDKISPPRALLPCALRTLSEHESRQSDVELGTECIDRVALVYS